MPPAIALTRRQRIRKKSAQLQRLVRGKRRGREGGPRGRGPRGRGAGAPIATTSTTVSAPRTISVPTEAGAMPMETVIDPRTGRRFKRRRKVKRLIRRTIAQQRATSGQDVTMGIFASFGGLDALGISTTAAARGRRATAAAMQIRNNPSPVGAEPPRGTRRIRGLRASALRTIVKRKERRLDRAHKRTQTSLDTLADQIDSGQMPATAASIGRRRTLAAVSTALFVRRQRLQVANRFLDEAVGSAPSQQEGLRRGALAVIAAPISAQEGRFRIVCRGGGLGGGDFAEIDLGEVNEEIALSDGGFGDLGISAGATYTGFLVSPQAAQPLFVDMMFRGLKQAIQASTLPANFVPPNVIEIPTVVTFPGVAQHQVQLPDFRPGLRTKVQPPTHLEVSGPMIRIGPQGQPVIPAAAQGPAFMQTPLPRIGPVPPMALTGPSARMLRASIPVPGGELRLPVSGGLAPRQGATTLPAMVTPGTGSQTAGQIEESALASALGAMDVDDEFSIPYIGGPSRDDMGRLNPDQMVADVEGIFAEVVLTAEVDDEIALEGGDFGQARGRPRLARARRVGRQQARGQAGGQAGRGRGRGGKRKIRFRHRLRAGKLRAGRRLNASLLGVGLAAAGRVNPAVGFVTGAVAGKLARGLAGKQARREARLAGQTGFRFSRGAMGRRRNRLARGFRAGAVRTPCVRRRKRRRRRQAARQTAGPVAAVGRGVSAPNFGPPDAATGRRIWAEVTSVSGQRFRVKFNEIIEFLSGPNAGQVIGASDPAYNNLVRNIALVPGNRAALAMVLGSMAINAILRAA